MSCQTNARLTLVGFTSSTSLHGYAYTTGGRNLVEAVLWCMVCLAALVWTAAICLAAFQEWRDNPVLST